MALTTEEGKTFNHYNEAESPKTCFEACHDQAACHTSTRSATANIIQHAEQISHTRLSIWPGGFCT